MFQYLDVELYVLVLCLHHYDDSALFVECSAEPPRVSQVGGDRVTGCQDSEMEHDDSVLPSQPSLAMLLWSTFHESEGFSNLQIRQRKMSAII